MRTVLIVLLAAAALLGGLMLSGINPLDALTRPSPSQASNDADPQPSGPRITRIEFPDEISADGEPVSGYVHFRAPSGALTNAHFEVVEADFFSPFSFDPEITNTTEGSIQFYVSTSVPQHVTLRVTLADEQGRTSPPAEFSFQASASTSDQMP